MLRMTEIRSLDAEVVQYRARIKGRTLARKTVHARVPVAVTALLRLRLQRDGVKVPEGRVARVAVELMEKYAFDPVSTVASLTPSFFLCPTASPRMLGSGDNGAVFLEEGTGNVIKVMIDDDAPHEYQHLCAFASVGLAPQPVDLWGPRRMNGEQLYNIRMEAVDYTLLDLLFAEAPGSKRCSPTEEAASSVGSSLAEALSDMRSHGLVHGDLHAGNVGLKQQKSHLAVLLLDFSRSANLDDKPFGQHSNEFLAGHEYDVFNVMNGLLESFKKISDDIEEDLKKREQQMRGLRRRAGNRDLHFKRQLADDQAYLEKKEGALQRVELVYNSILRPVSDYARTLRCWSLDGSPTVRNRDFRTMVSKRVKASYAAYFKSDLYWGDFQYKE